MTSNITTTDHPVIPPDAKCFYDSLDNFASFSPGCRVANDMVSVLNLTGLDFRKGYLAAYCTVGPLENDDCPYGYCLMWLVSASHAAWRKSHFHGIVQPICPHLGLSHKFSRWLVTHATRIITD